MSMLACAGTLASLIAPAARAQVMAAPVPGDPVQVTGGKIAGQTLPSGVRAYLGIPFAAPPVEALRWKAPQPVPDWNGTRYTLRFAPMCPQTTPDPSSDSYYGPEPISEDCLYLNVWAPKTHRGARLPVVVWLFGGAFVTGSGSMARANGEHLAQKGVIFVSLNYRVGALGFLAHPELTAESPHHSSGNYGLLDDIACLQWVRANIARFGGDPENVTLMGQSSGAMSVAALHASPLARGLFHRAIGLSGSVLTLGPGGGMLDRSDAEKVGLELQRKLGAAGIADMRKIPAGRIVQEQGRHEPNIDGYLMPESPFDIYAKGKQSPATLMVGFTRDEGFDRMNVATSPAQYEAAMRRTYPKEADRLLQLYPADDNWRSNARTAARDLTASLSVWRWAAAQAASGTQPAYAVMFSRAHPYPAQRTDPRGAYHGGDVAYWTQNLDAYDRYGAKRAWSAWDRALSDKMSSMVVAFARTGNPSIPGVIAPPFSAHASRVLELGDRIDDIPWPNDANRAFLDTVSAPQGVPMSTSPRTAVPPP
jgi:para-nitrobenzyl esterase